jgi:thioredoxin-related protein
LSLNEGYAQPKLSVYDSLEIMPNFKYYQLNGLLFTPDSLAPNKQTVMIYFKKDCPYCEKQGEIISTYINDSNSVEFVFITREDSAFINYFANFHRLSVSKQVKFVQDKERLYYKYCKASYTPSIHVYDKKRKLLLFHEGVLDDKRWFVYLN